MGGGKNCGSISMQKSRSLVDKKSNHHMGQLFSSVKIRFYCFSLWEFAGVAFTSFSLTTHRNSSKIDDFHRLSLLHWHIIMNFTPCGAALDIWHNTNSSLMLLVFALRCEVVLTPWLLKIILYLVIRVCFFFRFFAFACFSFLTSYFYFIPHFERQSFFYPILSKEGAKCYLLSIWACSS